MGKPDTKQAKLNFDNKRQTRQGDTGQEPYTEQGLADDTDAESTDIRSLLLEVKSTLKTMETQAW